MVEVVFENFVNYLRSGNTDKLNIISFQQNQQHKINLSTQLIFYRILTKTVVQLITNSIVTSELFILHLKDASTLRAFDSVFTQNVFSLEIHSISVEFENCSLTFELFSEDLHCMRLRFHGCVLRNVSKMAQFLEESTVIFNDSRVINSSDMQLFKQIENSVFFARQTHFLNVNSSSNLITDNSFNLKLELKQCIFENIIIQKKENGGLVGSLIGFFIIQNIALINVNIQCESQCGTIAGELYASGRAFDVAISGSLTGNVSGALFGIRRTSVTVEVEKVQLFTETCTQEEVEKYHEEMIIDNVTETFQIITQFEDLPDDYIDIECIKIRQQEADEESEEQEKQEQKYDDYQSFYKQFEFARFYQYCKKNQSFTINDQKQTNIIGEDEVEGDGLTITN
ncbi:Hypothetical_protein [Hexamita inflata]|uniref:Hypothetical_protein n=1 Tax=Hexamita inflata TaxID=28002 RepID=A0AA86R3Q3_9EUKA|nr:Hypothetical protein HINF_LOCUS57560 [Hexamita inflata]